MSPHPGSPGTTTADLPEMRRIGSELGDAARHLGDAVDAVDALPVDAAASVLGAVGADFAAALLAATARHREVTESLARTVQAAGELVQATAESFEASEDSTVVALRGVDGVQR